MPAASRGRRFNRMDPQLIRDALQFLNVNIVHESGNLYSARDKRKVESTAIRKVGRLSVSEGVQLSAWKSPGQIPLLRLRRRDEVHHRDDAFKFLPAINDKQLVRAAANHLFHHFVHRAIRRHGWQNGRSQFCQARFGCRVLCVLRNLVKILSG